MNSGAIFCWYEVLDHGTWSMSGPEGRVNGIAISVLWSYYNFKYFCFSIAMLTKGASPTSTPLERQSGSAKQLLNTGGRYLSFCLL